MSLVKQCANHLCRKLIWRDQYKAMNDYCDKDCEQEVHHWKSSVEHFPKLSKNMKIHPELYPHKYLPCVLEIK